MAIKKGVKKKEGENLTDSYIERVINLLEAEKPITKKEACEVLNIAYNTTRLTKIINEYKENQENDKKRRAANRGKPATDHEIQIIIEGYLEGDSIAEIGSILYRPSSFVKKVIEDIGVPEKSASYLEPSIIPEQCVSDNFEFGQIAWSARYSAMVIILDCYPANSKNNNQEYDCYRIYVIETIEEPSPYFPNITGYGGKNAISSSFDLGSLEHLKKFGIDIYKPYRNSFPKWLNGR